MISILLVDDHSIVRSGLKLLINSEPDMKVTYEADNGIDAVRIALNKQPDVIVMDLNLPKKSGLTAIKRIIAENDQTKIIVLTMHDDRDYIFRVMKAGASSYLLKSNRESDLIESIRKVYRGETYLYPENSTEKAIGQWYKPPYKKRGRNELTNREQEVLEHVAKGYTNREIGELLHVSTKTIEAHRSNIMKKLNFKTRAQLVQYAITNGYLDTINMS